MSLVSDGSTALFVRQCCSEPAGRRLGDVALNERFSGGKQDGMWLGVHRVFIGGVAWSAFVA